MNFFRQPFRWGLCFFAIWAFSALMTGPGYGQEDENVSQEEIIDTAETQKVIIYRGDLVEMKVYGMTRIAIVEPGIIEIVNADVEQILVVGNNEGETPVFIWDAKGKRKIEIQVINKDLEYSILRIQRLFDAAKVTGVKIEKNELEGKIQLTGKVAKEKKDAFDKILDKFSDQTINMVTEDNKLIEIDVQVTELNTTMDKVMGVDWSTGAEGSLIFTYKETLPAAAGTISDWFKIGDFTRSSALLATVSFLISEGKARVLSKPNVVVTNGDSATFLVGGEIPITTTTTSEGNVSQNISYKSYGIDLSVTPTIREEKIDIMLSVAIRDIDASNSIGGNTAFTTRTADTKLLLDDGQTIVLAGLIKQDRGVSESWVPLLGRIPVVGLLFRKKTWTPNKDVEVVISLTPRILKGPNTESFANTQPPALSKVNEPNDDLLADTEIEKGIEEAVLSNEELPAAEDTAEAVDNALIEKVQEISPEVENVSPVITEYVQAVQKKISQAISFPYEAKEKGWEGTVTLTLKILSDGKLNKAALKESSGRDIFDKDALNTAQIVAPFAPFPAEIDLEELDVTIPVSYSQKAILDGETEAASEGQEKVQNAESNEELQSPAVNAAQ